jgi:hypothetical protein
MFPSSCAYRDRVPGEVEIRNEGEKSMIKTIMANPMDFAHRHWPVIGLLALLVVALALTAYAVWPRTAVSTSGTAPIAGTAPTPAWSRVCVSGVSYLQFTSGATVEWTPAGKVKTCSESAK